jgi:hypothetical protein
VTLQRRSTESSCHALSFDGAIDRGHRLCTGSGDDDTFRTAESPTK